MLPGTIAMAGAAANDETSITLSYVDAATSTTASITAPGGIASGDLAIYIDHASDGDNPGDTATPSGFTSFFNLTGGVWRLSMSYKILAGTETTITGMDGSATDTKVMLVYRPSSAITAVVPLAQASWNRQIGTTSNPSSQSTTLAGQSVPLVFIGMAYGSGSAGAFSTESPSFDATHTAGNLRVGRKLYNNAPQNHTIDMNDLGTNTLASGYIQVN